MPMATRSSGSRPRKEKIMHIRQIITTMGGSRGGVDRGSEPPLKNLKNLGFLSNTGPDPLINHKATKQTFNIGPSLARQRNAVSMACQLMARF